jgi:hypothetical protein
MSLPDSINFDFLKNKEFLGMNSAGSIQITPSTDANVYQALIANSRFPEGEIQLGKISLRTQADKAIKFKKGNVNLNFSGGVESGLAVYQNPQKLLSVLAPDNNTSPAIHFAEEEENIYSMLKCTYDAKAAAKGSMGLGTAGTVSADIDVRKNALYAIVRSFPNTTGAKDVVANTINSLILPTNVDNIDDLEPGTWLIAEIDGSIAASLGINLGYDFNWVREATLNQLSGDIGLRIQLGVGATLGFGASGKYALVLSRESLNPSDKTIHLRIFKLNKKNWNVAVNASAKVQGDFSNFLPEKSDDFIAAVLGIQGTQIITDLKAVEKWISETDIQGKLAELGKDYIYSLFHEVTGIDPVEKYKEAHDKISDLLDKWKQLPNNVVSLLWTLISEETQGKIDDFRKLLKDMVSYTDPQDVKDLMLKELEKIEFFKTPFGKWLESVASQSILSILQNLEDNVKPLKDSAEKTLKIIDKGTVEEMLRNLQKSINDKLNVDKIMKIATEADFENIDKLLKQKLSDFLGKTVDFKKIKEIQDTIKFLMNKRNDIYQKVKTALNKEYDFSLTAGYSKATSEEALVDVNFDFSNGDGTISELLQQAVDGNFDTLFTQQVEGITLKEAVLSHQVQRQSHLELTMPFLDHKTKSINEALSKVEALDDDGRILLYQLDASDRVYSINKGKSARDSQLAISMEFKDKIDGVRIHSDTHIKYSYSYRMARKNMKVDALNNQISPYIKKYFPNEFGQVNNGTVKKSFKEWLIHLDKTMDQIADNGDGNLGYTLISLDVSLPKDVMSGWFNAPAKKSKEFRNYEIMAHRLQKKLRELVPFYYFQDLTNYRNRIPAAVLLVYSSLPPLPLDWDWPDKKTREELIINETTKSPSLALNVEKVYQQLQEAGLFDIAELYKPEKGTYDEIINRTLRDDIHFITLLAAEDSVIETAYEAGLEMAKFKETSEESPAKALKLLAEFGAKLTRGFHKKIHNVYNRHLLRPLGTFLMIEAAATFDPDIADTQPSVMLELDFLKSNSSFKLENYLKDKAPEEDDIIHAERIINLS